MSRMNIPTNNADTLQAAVHGYRMEHGVWPDFILLTSDVASAIFDEVDKNRAKYASFVQIGGDMKPMKMMDIEIGQIQGRGRVELVADPTVFKALRSL